MCKEMCGLCQKLVDPQNPCQLPKAIERRRQLAQANRELFSGLDRRTRQDLQSQPFTKTVHKP